MAIPALLAGLGGRAAAGGMGARMGQFAGMNAAGSLLSGGGQGGGAGGGGPFGAMESMDRMASADVVPTDMDMNGTDNPFGL